MPNNNGGPLRETATTYYIIRFGDYYTGDDGIRGRIIELAPLNNEDGSYTYELGYVLGAPRISKVLLFTDQDVSILVNSLNVYNHQVDDQFVNFPFDALSPDGVDELSGDNVFDGRIKDNNAYFALDPNWSNNVEPTSTPRVQIAQGQSDITRHESYFKEEMCPNYKFEDMPKEIKELIELLGVEKPEDISFNLIGNGSLCIFATDPDPDLDKPTVIANQYEYREKAGESIKSYHYTLDDVDKNELLNYSKAVVSNAWKPLEGISYFILSSESMKYLDGKATVLGG